MKPYLKIKDHSISGEDFELYHDEDLDMLVTKPQPHNHDAYYQSDGYISHTDANKTLIDKMYQTVKKYSLRKKIKSITKYIKGTRTLLDIGAGTGDFLLAAKEKQWQVTGIEPNRDARMRASKKGLDLFATMKALGDKKYAVITLWHVLEHLPDLDNQVVQMIDHLADNGTLVIAVPNFKSKDASYYKAFWAGYDVPRHLWHFSQSAIKKIFAKHKLQLVETRPMIFDAFYVALLSEKYKLGRSSITNLPKAFFVGLWSNIGACRSGEFSSIIYILKKSQ